MVTVNRPANHFWNHVISGAEPDRAEPKEKEIVPEPPGHGRLHHALHRHHEKHDLGRAVDPWEPEEGAEQIPLRDVNVFTAPETKHDHRPRDDERIRDEKDCRGVRGELEPLIAGAVARQDAAHAQKDAEIPESAAHDEEQRMAQGRPAQTRHEPDRGANAGHRRPAENHHVHVRGPDSSPGQPTVVREKIGGVKFEGGKAGEQRAEQEPEDCRSIEKQDRQPRRRIDQGTLDLFDIVRRDFTARCGDRGIGRRFQRNLGWI